MKECGLPYAARTPFLSWAIQQAHSASRHALTFCYDLYRLLCGMASFSLLKQAVQGKFCRI